MVCNSWSPGPGRGVNQEQEDISRNFVQTIFLFPVQHRLNDRIYVNSESRDEISTKKGRTMHTDGRRSEEGCVALFPQMRRRAGAAVHRLSNCHRRRPRHWAQLETKESRTERRKERKSTALRSDFRALRQRGRGRRRHCGEGERRCGIRARGAAVEPPLKRPRGPWSAASAQTDSMRTARQSLARSLARPVGRRRRRRRRRSAAHRAAASRTCADRSTYPLPPLPSVGAAAPSPFVRRS